VGSIRSFAGLLDQFPPPHRRGVNGEEGVRRKESRGAALAAGKVGEAPLRSTRGRRAAPAAEPDAEGDGLRAAPEDASAATAIFSMSPSRTTLLMWIEAGHREVTILFTVYSEFCNLLVISISDWCAIFLF
jgi:hypothetical protein